MDNIYKRIANEYERRRKEAEEKAELRKAELYSKIPSLADIDKEISNFGIKLSKSILSSSNKEEYSALLSDITEKIDSLKNKKNEMIKKAGYPEDFCHIQYSCPVCKDTGFTGRTPDLEKCSCFKQQIINIAYSQSNLACLETENFSTFEEKYFSDAVDEKKYGIRVSPRENILFIKDRCLQFVENFNEPNGNSLLFSGQSGLGKSFLSNCIAKELLDRGRIVLYQTAPALFNKINEYKAKSFSDGGAFDDSFYKDIFEVDLLIIDDLGAETSSASKFTELFNIINTRILNNSKKSCRTIISTNLGIKEMLESYTDRVSSRIYGHFDMYKFIGEDIRKIKKSLS